MNIEIANRLVNLRKEKNLTQEALAEQLGISRQAVSKWERAEASPDTDNLILLARLYGVSLDELLKTEDEIPMPEEVKTGTENHNENTYTEQETYGNGAGQTGYAQSHSARREEHRNHALWFPIDIVIVVAYLLLGSLFNAWHPAWLIFLLIPLWHSLMEAIEKKNANVFAYPVLATIIFFILGFFFGAWHPGWVIFVTIPAYYSIASWYNHASKEEREE